MGESHNSFLPFTTTRVLSLHLPIRLSVTMVSLRSVIVALALGAGVAMAAPRETLSGAKHRWVKSKDAVSRWVRRKPLSTHAPARVG